MPGFLGSIGGKLKPMNDSGTHLMDGPFTQKITWNYDYTIPIIILIVIVLVIAGVVFFVFRRRGGRSSLKMETAPATRADFPSQASQEASKPPDTVTKKALPAAKPSAELNFCPKCGNPIRLGDEFCGKCGKKLE